MIADHDRYRDDVAAHAFGALTQPERAELERHLQGCEACRRDLARFRAVVDKLSSTVEPPAARTRLKQEMLQRVRDSEIPGRPPRLRRSLSRGRTPSRVALAGAGLLASAALVAGGFVARSSLSEDGRQTLRAAVDRAGAPGASATLEREGDIGVLRASNLASLDDGVYVLWLDRGAGPVYASSFNAGAGGMAEAGISNLTHVEHVMVTREASPRVARPTTRPILTVRVQKRGPITPGPSKVRA